VTFEPETIINLEDFVSERVVKSIASTDDISILKLNGPGVGLKSGILAGITGLLSDHSINIKSVITSQVSINILLDRETGQKAKQLAEKLGFTAVSEIELLEGVTLVAIVGHGMLDHYGIPATLFSAIAGSKINMILSGSGASDLVSYLIIRAADKQKCVRAVYDAFFQS
jgi:aspartate kinase/aspartokinase/homoserine dehydrogenase 1